MNSLPWNDKVIGTSREVSVLHPTADISDSSIIAESSSVWNYAQVRENAQIGENCVIGRAAYIGSGVRIGDNCKVQNNALIYEPASISNGVFIGPAVVLTNDHYPRAVNPDGTIKSASDWEPVGVTIEEGASVGARSVCVAPVTIGAWSLVAAGSVVVKNVPKFALVAGVPAKRIGWVGKAGHPLNSIDLTTFECPVTGEKYTEINGELEEAI